MTFDDKNKTYALAKSVRLSDKQIKDLLNSGLDPQFRSLAGILQDAAEMGAIELYNKLAAN